MCQSEELGALIATAESAEVLAGTVEARHADAIIAQLLVRPFIYTALFYGGFAVAVIGLLCIAIGATAQMNAKRAKKERLPEALLADKRPRNGTLWQLLGAFALIGGPAASIWLWFHSNQIVLVRDGAGEPRTDRRVWIGSAYSPQRSLDAYPRRRATWIVNESSISLIAQSYGYGDSSTSPPVSIPPGASLPVDSVDYLGPHDPPPGQITIRVPSELARSPSSQSARRVWLSWQSAESP